MQQTRLREHRLGRDARDVWSDASFEETIRWSSILTFGMEAVGLAAISPPWGMRDGRGGETLGMRTDVGDRGDLLDGRRDHDNRNGHQGHPGHPGRGDGEDQRDGCGLADLRAEIAELRAGLARAERLLAGWLDHGQQRDAQPGARPPTGAAPTGAAPISAVAGAAVPGAAVPAAGAGFAVHYPAFTDRFRGGEEEISRRLEVYLPDVDRFVAGRGVLDLGPGRGEWLRMLAARGVDAVGVDADPTFVAAARVRGLCVVVGDVLDHLRTVGDGTLDLVTAFHVVEHLATDELLAVLVQARRVLRPGGGLILETPDPTNLAMGACNFYLDPTHRRPVPPALAEFLVTTSGFAGVEIRRLHPREQVDLSALRLDGVEEATARLVGAALTSALFGPQDYAVVAVAA
ncbi:bifunctional 2-polyprenyl-6-hydroxyphenol methylase/3-demethylubiquinol 3-O-methyltransferase UbiG [Frankia sp. QA3]|uniref:class I SAM-dependent methyltransferase n=1 Tax=Frankia sp. QA3 TaxID=710111 RepID=UPI000269C101|nr:class I SAM-dependent methyltransferase [Frankia sp. QA3]EIV92530.1 methyltransferase family protein [Frankia sp. QA3]